MQISSVRQNYTYTMAYQKSHAKKGADFSVENERVELQASIDTIKIKDDATKIGTKYTLRYDTKNKQIIANNGEKDALVDLFNDNASDEQLNQLNHYDLDIKNFLNGILFNPIDRDHKALSELLAMEGDEVDIGVEILTPGEIKFSYLLNGEPRSIVYGTGEWYIKEDFAEFSKGYQTSKHKDYDPATNSIAFAIGDTFMVNGTEYIMTSENIRPKGSLYEGYGAGFSREELEEQERYTGAISRFMTFAEGSAGSDTIMEEDTPLVLSFLSSQGVDISKEFTVNNTKCHVVDGKIIEVGNTYGGDPLYIKNRVFDRQNSWELLPLGSDNPYPTFRDFVKAFRENEKSRKQDDSYEVTLFNSFLSGSVWMDLDQARQNYLQNRIDQMSDEMYDRLLDDLHGDENNSSDDNKEHYQERQYIDQFEIHQQYVNGEISSREYSYN